MAVVWKINGVDIATLLIDKFTLGPENQRADKLTFEIPGEQFDTDALSYELNSDIVLTRTQDGGAPVTWFSGIVRQTPRTCEPGGEFIGYVVEGPWQWFERITYLQNFKTPTDPSNVASALTNYLRSRTILAQSDAGLKVNLGAFLNAVFDYAKTAADAAHGSAVMQRPDFSAISGLQVTIPWDEVTDLMCDEVFSRALQCLPDAVEWWDYTTTPPTLNINRRAALTALTLAVIPTSALHKSTCRVASQSNLNLASPGASIDAIALAADDRVLVKAQTAGAENGIYVWTGAASTMTRATDADAAAELNRAVVDVREGTNADDTFVQTATVATLGTDAVTWVQAVRGVPVIRERPDLQREGVVLIYIKTHRENEAMWETREIDDHPDASDPSSPGVLVRTIQLAGSVSNVNTLTQRVEVDPLEAYLTTAGPVSSGATFDSLATWWKKHTPELRAAGVTIKAFRAGTRTKDDGGAITAACENELLLGAVTDWMEDRQDIETEQQLIQIEVTYEVTDPHDATRKERIVKQLAAIVTATNAETKTYAFTESASFTPAEATPIGLAQAIYDAISPMEYEGSLRLSEREASRGVLVGRKVNLGGGLAQWATMGALVQRGTIDIERGITTIDFGPPKHLGPDDRVELYRVNRNRQPVTSYLTRTEGKSGSTETRQGLSKWHPVKPGGTANHAPARVYTQSVTVAGVVPTSTEIQTALNAAYTSNNRPRAGDTVNLTVSGTVKLRAVVTLTDPGSGGIFNVSFVEDSVTYYAQIHQVGIY